MVILWRHWPPAFHARILYAFPFSGKFFDEAKLVIKLQDENDNSPAFQSKEYPLSVSEDIEVGEQLVQLC